MHSVSFVDSTMIPVCHNLRWYANKVFKSIATDGKCTIAWCHGFKPHLLWDDGGDIITFCLTRVNVDDRSPKVWNAFAKELYGKVYADRGYTFLWNFSIPRSKIAYNLFMDCTQTWRTSTCLFMTRLSSEKGLWLKLSSVSKRIRHNLFILDIVQWETFSSISCWRILLFWK